MQKVPPSAYHLQLGRSTVYYYALLLVILLSLIGAELLHTREEAKRAAEQEASSLALLAASSLENTFHTSEHILELMRNRISPAALDRAAVPKNAEKISKWLHDFEGPEALLSGLRYFDRTGERLYSSNLGEPALNIADREHFSEIRTRKDSSTLYSEVVLGRITKRPVIFAEKAILSEQREFLGSALLVLDVGSMRDLLRKMQLAPSGSIAIRRLDNGAALVRYPGKFEIDNQAHPDLETRKAILAGNSEGILAPTTSPIDGVKRLYAYQRIGDFPFFVSVGIAESDYLHGWHSKVYIYLATLFGLATALFLLERARQSRHAEAIATERKFRAIIEASPVPSALNDDKGNIVYINPALTRCLGYTHQDIPTLAEWFPKAYPDAAYREEVMARWQKAVLKAKSTATPFQSQEVKVTAADGRVCTMLASAAVLDDSPETPHLVTLVDVSALKHQEAEIDAQRRRLDDILTGTHVGTWEWNVQSGEVIFNERWAEIIGYTLEELAPVSINTWLEFAHPDDLKHSGELLERHFAGSLPNYECEARMRHKNGDWVWVLDRGKVSSWTEDGKPLLMSGTHQDIHQRKTMEQELLLHRQDLEKLVAQRTADLEVAKEAAEAASRAKSAFLSVASHELRTPLHGIMGSIGIALRKSTDSVARDYLTKANRASQQLLQIINDVLEISRIESNRLTLAKTGFTFSQVVTHLRDTLDTMAREKQLSLSFAVDAQVMQKRLVGDPTRLGQILVNLIGNAIKFTEQGGVTVTANLAPGTDGRWFLRCDVTDTGIGIRTEDQQRIFTPFEQVDTSNTRRYGGTGLGLALCSKLIEAMQGRLGLHSTFGEGSTFWFEVPLNEEVSASSDVAAEENYGETLRTEFLNASVLIAEDEPLSQEIIQEMLKSVGISVRLAPDGATAVEYATQGKFDLILMDLNMPIIDGIEATQKIRQIQAYANTPIVGLTANAFAEDRQSCLNAGMSDHLSKPVTADLLYKTVLHWLRHQRRAISRIG